MTGAPRFPLDDLTRDDRRAAVERAIQAGGVDLDAPAGGRLPVRALASLAVVRDGARIVGASADARLALAVLGLERFLAEAERVPPPAAANLAFSARPDGAALEIDVERKASDDGRMAHPSSHRWMSGLTAEVVVVDFGRLEHVNSSVVAWLLLLAQAAKPAKLELRKVHRQVQAQLTQLRLNHLLTVRDS